jgi:C4-dicarboxylate-specific signal transduction histidine kinase
VIRRASERTVRIVQALSGFARTSVEAVPSNLDVALDETLALLGGRLRQAAIEVDRLGEPLPLVTCRSHEISQIFLNVIVNAIDAIEGVGAAVDPEDRAVRPRRIAVRTERIEGEVVLAFSDTGPGLSAALADRAFEPFVTTKPAGQGTGLGLSISRDLARRHGGRLEVERDTSLGGARFVLRLPVAGPRRAGGSASA